MLIADAYETKQAIRKGLDSMEFASLPAIVKTAQSLAKKVDTLTNYELANLISKDPFALAKVMDMANRGSRTNNVEITKLEDAILKVGFRKVRNMAFSLLDMEAAKAKLRYHEQGETAAYALCSCVIAERVMQEVGHLDPQEAYAVAVLRSYGRVLMAAFMIHYYREAVLLIPEKGVDAAFRHIFGLSPLELTYELLKDTRVPKDILRALKHFNPEILELEFISDNELLIINAEFSLEFTRLIFGYYFNEQDFHKKALELLERFHGKIPLREDQLFRIVSELGEVIEGYKKQYGIEPLTKGMNSTLHARSKLKDPPPPPPKDADPDNPDDIEHRLHKDPELLLSDCAREIAWLASKRPPEVEAINESLVRGLHNGLGCDHVILFQRQDEGDALLSYTGFGELFEKSDQRTISPEDKDIFGVCLSRRYNALIYDTGETSMRPFLPVWLREANVNSLLLMPIWDESPDPEDEEPLPIGIELPPVPPGMEEDDKPIDQRPFMVLFCANSNGQTAIQLKNTMSRSILGIRRHLIKALAGHTMAPSFLLKDPAEAQLDLAQFTREARRAVVGKRQRSGIVF